MENLSPEEQRLLDGELSRGESLLWAGKPNPRVIFHPSDWFLIPFGLIWGGFALFWGFGASKGGGTFFALWGIPFIVVGQYMIWGRFVYTAWRKARVVYALTTERVLTLVEPPQAKVISSYLRNLPGVNTSVRSDGIGTLRFGSDVLWMYGRRSGFGDDLSLSSNTPVFADIDGAAQVAGLINEQMRKLSTGSAPPPLS